MIPRWFVPASELIGDATWSPRYGEDSLTSWQKHHVPPRPGEASVRHAVRANHPSLRHPGVPHTTLHTGVRVGSNGPASPSTPRTVCSLSRTRRRDAHTTCGLMPGGERCARPADSRTRQASRATARGAGEAVYAGGAGKHQILETRDRILTEGCGMVSASPEHDAVAARHR